MYCNENFRISGKNPRAIRSLLFDFGGVIASEGFKEGLFAIARSQDKHPPDLYQIGSDAVYDSGYVIGKGTESDFWDLVRKRAGVRGTDAELTGKILEHFIVRPGMIARIRELRQAGYGAVILSDQTDWLDKLEKRYRFYGEFDRVFNSYHLGKGKRDATIFCDVLEELGLSPEEAIFIDDSQGNCERASAQGLRVILFENEEKFLKDIEKTLLAVSDKCL